MKHTFATSCIILLFALMLIFPQAVFQGASTGLILWFQTVLPTLLPFIILSNLLIQTGAVDWAAAAISPVLCRFFRVSPYGAFAVLTGFLCGCPMGSKVTADLLKQGSITHREACYLLSFCNNTSPMFMISFVIWQNLRCEELTCRLLAVLMLSPVLLSFLFRRYYKIPAGTAARSHRIRKSGDRNQAGLTASLAHGSEERHRFEHDSRQDSDFVPGSVDDCIMNGFETITRIGGYMMLFSIILSLAKLLPWKTALISSVLLPSLEITSGIDMICSTGISARSRIIRSLSLTAFGGWCAAAQTKAMINHTSLPFLPYIAEKLITALVTSLLACVVLL